MHLVPQTLHGYDQGHRLLAVGGDVDEGELAQLDRLSDLSGYVPIGTEFDHYYTGFPCGRYYAFACTWPDLRATRAGTVLTHTLLLPRDLLDELHDPWRLQGHRRPESAKDREPFLRPLSLEFRNGVSPAVAPAPDRAAADIVLWFGQDERPVLWTEDGGAEDVIRYLWSLLWGAARWDFSFCTFALQVRYLRRQPFGFLVLPQSAVGSFHDRARSPAWWQNGQLSDGLLRERIGQSWVRTILERGMDATHAMPRYCSRNQLPLLDAYAFPVFHRFTELETPAKERLVAARSRADLLAKLWPDLDHRHPLVEETLGFVLQHQSDAPLTPRPFWDLIDLVKRSALLPIMDANVEFARRVESTMEREVGRRILEADDIKDVGNLVGAVKQSRLRENIVKAVGNAFARMTDEASRTTKGCASLLSSVGAGTPEIVEAVMRPLPSANREAIALRALEEVSPKGQTTLADYVREAAIKLDEIAIVIEVWCKLGQPLRALEEATTMVLDSADLRPERLNRILDRLEADKRLTWALSIEDPRLMPWAGKKGSIAANELKHSLPQLSERCSGQPNAGQVLLAYLDGVSLASQKDEDLFHPSIVNLLAELTDSNTARKLADALAPRLVRRVANGWNIQEALPWFLLGAMQDALARVSDWTLFSGYQSASSWDRNCLPNLARAAAETIRTKPPASLVWVVNLLGKPLQDGPEAGLSRAIDDLVTLVDTPSSVEGWSILAARILLAVRRNPVKHGYLLVERIFPVLYPKLTSGELDSPTMTQLRSIIWRDWDVAKAWRHWILDVWLRAGWPGASFLRSLGNDIALFRRIAYRAWHKEREKDFVRGLSGSWGRDDDLAARWRGPVNRFLSDPDADLDYE